MTLLDLALLELEDGDGTRSFEVVRELKSGAQRDGRRVEALAGVQSPVWVRACTVLSTGAALFLRLMILARI